MNNFIEFLDQFNVLSPNHSKIYDEYTINSEEEYNFSISTRVEHFLLEIFNSNPRSVIMTGNAGDGKTRLCRTIYEKLTGEKLMNWPVEGIVEIPFQFGTLRIVKDLSELTEKVIKDELLSLQRVVSNYHTDKLYYLIAANEGKLTKFLSQNPELNHLSEWIRLRFLNHQNNNEHLHLVNLQDVTSSIYADRIIEEWNNEKYWTTCAQCPKQDKCIIFYNHRQMSEPHVRKNLVEQYRLLDCMGIHVTMREILIHLSYTITGGLTCENVLKASYKDIEDHGNRAYYNNFYGNMMPEVSAGEMGGARYFINLDPGLTSISLIDDFILNGDISGDKNIVSQHEMIFSDDIDLLFGYYRKRIEQYRTLDPNQDKENTKDVFDQMPRFRRKFFFECGEYGKELRNKLLPYQYFSTFVDCLENQKSHSLIRRELIHGLNQAFTKKLIGRSEPQALYAVNEHLLIHGIYGSTQVKIALEEQRNDIDHIPSYIKLQVQQVAELEVRLPVFEYLLRLANGSMFSILRQEVEILINKFKNDLINSSELDEYSLEVLALNADRGVYAVHNIEI